MNDVRAHYDRLIDENNDPVLDPPELKAYMDLWDGQDFIDRMALAPDKKVLEIGVGTGRLAVHAAPRCGEFYGVDLSEKTLIRAREHLGHLPHVHLICGDFLSCDLPMDFDVIYSSLTFMHIPEKQAAISKAAALLKKGGRFLLSLDKNPSPVIDMGTWQLPVFPDDPGQIRGCLMAADLEIREAYETEMAHIFLAVRPEISAAESDN